jgi:hypothetical protein
MLPLFEFLGHEFAFVPLALPFCPEVTTPFNPRRLALGAAKKLIFDNEDPERALERLAGLESNLAGPESSSMSRTRTTILNNLDEMYREAFERARVSGDQTQMATLDFAYRREQLYFEILLDVRDALERR